jgi:CTP synthase
MKNGNNILDDIAQKSQEHEFYTPIPEGYKTGKTKFIIIYGTVMSGIGKGIFSSSLAKLMQEKGLKVEAIKFDGYLNIDAGTLNPYRHGEVFVLDDGTECDMDLGTYERILHFNLSKDNYMTGGKIFSSVLDKERKGKYLGRDVQFIPHVTGEIKRFMRKLAIKSDADIIFMEVGGTVGDIENQYCIESIRELAYEEGQDNVCNVALTYVLEPQFLGEQKSKAAQQGIKLLHSNGIHPQIIACRSHNPVTEKVREKISIYSNVPMNNVVSLHDLDSIYNIPEHLRKTGIAGEIIEILELKDRVREKPEAEKEWNDFIRKLNNPKKTVKIGITGKYTGLRDSYASILKALEHAGAWNETDISISWIETTKLDKDPSMVEEYLKDLDGIIVPGGFGKRGSEGKINCIRYARENNIPYLGLCFGFQMAIIEFARTVCGLKDANSTELDPQAKHPVIDILPEQKDIDSLGGNMRLGGHDVLIEKETMAYELYNKKDKVRERFRHRFECNPDYIEALQKKGMVFSGYAKGKKIMQILEIPDHRFFVGVQFHPEYTSRPLDPNPLYIGFLKACIEKK